MYTGVWNSIVFFFLILSSGESIEAANSEDITDGVYGYVKNEETSPIVNADISLFDGVTLHVVKTDSDGGYKISNLPVSVNNYTVIFFTKEGYIPDAANLRIHEKKAIEYSVNMKRTNTRNAGFIIGTLYRPVRGGKLQFHSGIYSFGKKKQVRLEWDGEVIEKETDLEGHFLFEVPSGRYELSREGSRERVKIEVSKGQTTIRNLRSGFILID